MISLGWNCPVCVVCKFLSNSRFWDILVSVSHVYSIFDLVYVVRFSCNFLGISHFSESFGLFDFWVINLHRLPGNIIWTGRKSLLNKEYTKRINYSHKDKANKYVHDNFSSFGSSRCEGINATHKVAFLIVALSIYVEEFRITLLAWSLGVTVHASRNSVWTRLAVGVWHREVVNVKVVSRRTLCTGQVIRTALTAGKGEVTKNTVLKCLVGVVKIKVVTRITSCAISGRWATLTSGATSPAVEVDVFRIVQIQKIPIIATTAVIIVQTWTTVDTARLTIITVPSCIVDV